MANVEPVQPQEATVHRRRTDARTVAATAVFTAFVAAATSVFSVYIPATTGYFNVGEIMVYVSALLMGPYVGAFAGGVGSMISDLSLGYPYYAPGTLVIKGLEGFIVGYLGTRSFPMLTRRGWRIVTVGFGLAFSVALALVGWTFLSGGFAITLGGAWNIPAWTLELYVPPLFWPAAAALVFVVISYVGLRVEMKSGQSIMSVLAGGAEMVAGYYLYESAVLTLIAPAAVVASLAPAAEVPFNVAQALIGLLVSVPLTRSIRSVMGRRMGGIESGPKE
ncbi:MAG: ECF transporter S component [Thaumarchaeota archaeon]|nr:ECF transporter S component [Nitrososphaerota archaeon]